MHEEMFNIPGHKGNANQNLPHYNQNGHHQEHKQQQMLVRMRGKGNSNTLLVEM
jgi:hypothetical protein